MDNLYFKKLPSNALPSVNGNDVVLVATDSGDFILIDSNGAKTLLNVDKAFPVGTVLCRANDVSPASDIGGTWQKIAEGQTIIGASTAHPLNSTGGELAHTLSVDELPHITGKIREIAVQDENQVSYGGLLFTGVFSGEQSGSYVGYGTSKAWGEGEPGYTGVQCKDTAVLNFGNNQPHNNMQPYVAKNYWQRVA